MTSISLDPKTVRAAHVFMQRIERRFAIEQAILFGSRARQTHIEDSDADIAVIIEGQPGKRSAAALEMAGVAFDVLLETGILIEALPLWHTEFEHPETFSNPALIHAIQRDGVVL
ncbi:MAG: nucleotidyltransferase domain-containing protein [Sphingomonadaceae bacterium]